MIDTEEKTPEEKKMVIAERDELAKKISVQQQFLGTPEYDGLTKDERTSIAKKLDDMRAHHKTLNAEIEAF
jgi:hypothetical protein